MKQGHVIANKILVAVWGALLLLTAVTVTVSRIDLGALNVWIALGIASLKSALVILFFMHLKYEQPVLKAFFLLTLLMLAIFIGLTFTDILYR